MTRLLDGQPVPTTVVPQVAGTAASALGIRPEDEQTVNNYSAFKRISRAFNRGALSVEYGTLGFEVMTSPTPDVIKEQEDVAKRLDELGDDGTGFVSWLASAANIVGYQYGIASAPIRQASRVGEQFDELGGADFASRMGVALQGVTTPPVAILTNNYKSYTGDSYTNLIREGVEPNTAKMTAFTVGVLGTGLDAAGAVGAGTPIGLATKNLLKTQLTKVAASPAVLAAASRVVAAYGGAIGSETATEVMQEGIQIAAEEFGKSMSQEALAAATPEEIMARLEEVAVTTLKGMAILAAPGAGAQVMVEVQRARQAGVTQRAIDQIEKQLKEAPDPAIANQQATASLQEEKIEALHISADGLVAAANASGDPLNFYRKFGIDPKIVDEAALLGGDVRIDPQQFINIMQSDDAEALKYHIRIDEDDMTAAEAKEFQESGLKEEIEKLDEEKTEQEVVEETIRASGVTFRGKVYEGETHEKIMDQIVTELGIDYDTLTAELSPEFDGFVTSTGRFITNKKEAYKIAEAAGQLNKIAEGSTALNTDMVVYRDTASLKETVGEPLSGEQEQALGLGAFFKSAKDAGMTDLQYQNYLVTLQKAADSRNAAKERIRLRQLERETQAEIKAVKEQLAEVARETVDSQPVYGAINALGGRERLSKEKLEELGINPEQLPKARGRQIYEKGGTVNPETFAELYGFEGADIMAFAMMDAAPRETAIAAETQRLFDEQYVGLNQKQQELAAEIEALHNDAQASVLAQELNALRESIGDKKVQARLIKVAARDRLRDFTLKEINPKKFLAAERRAAREAAKLLRKGDRQGASKAKFRQLLNFHFAMEAYRVREKTKSQHKYLKKFTRRAKPHAKLPIDYFQAIQTMLGEIDLKRSRPNLVQFVAQKKLEGIIISIPMEVQVDNGKTSYLDLTLRKWEQMVDDVKGVEKQGLDENKLLREQENETRDAIAQEVAANVRANLKDVSSETVAPSRWESAVRNGRDLALNMVSAETIARTIDGFKELGPTHNAFVRRYFQAMTSGYQPGQVGYIAAHKKASQRLNAIVDGAFSKKEKMSMKKRVTVPGVPAKAKMNHERVIMVLMNLGNLENRKALVDGGWTEAQLDSIVNYASKKDWDFVQNIWDFLHEFWPDVVEATKRRRNVIPEKVEATPIDTPHGVYKGGYFPLMYAYDEVAMTRVAAESDVEKLLQSMKIGGYVQTQTKHGHTKNREDSGGKTVRLELYGINSHLNQVLYDLEMGDAVMDIYKLLYHKDVTSAFREMGQTQRWEQLSIWFADIVLGEKHMQDTVSRVFRRLRTGFVISNIAFKGMTVLLQPLGLVNTMVQLGKMNTLIALGTAAFNPRAAYHVASATPFMQQRSATFNYDIAQAETAFKESLFKKVTPGNTSDYVAAGAFLALVKMQKVVDVITWMAAQRQGVKQFQGDVVKANEFADNMVARAQSSGVFGLRTPLERGTTARNYQQNEGVKALIPFMSYFLAKANIAYERIKKTDPRSPVQVISLITDLLVLTLFEQLMASMLFGDWPDDEDDLPAFIAWQFVKAEAAMFPGVRDAVSFAEGFVGGGVPASVANQAGQFLKQASEGELDAGLARSAARITGTLARIPGTSQAIATQRAIEEESENPFDYLRGPPR